MELVTLALGSPHGRFFCANVAYKCSTDARAAGFNRPQTTADAREVIEGVDISAIWELSEMDLLEALAYDADLVRAWQPPNDDVKFADPHVVAALRPIAAAVLSSEHTAWWGEPVDVDNQRLVVMRCHPSSGERAFWRTKRGSGSVELLTPTARWPANGGPSQFRLPTTKDRRCWVGGIPMPRSG